LKYFSTRFLLKGTQFSPCRLEAWLKAYEQIPYHIYPPWLFCLLCIFLLYAYIISCNTNKLESVRFIMKETVQGNDTDDPGSRSRCRRVVFTGKSDLPVLSLQARGGF
jgi:hypothetical protein